MFQKVLRYTGRHRKTTYASILVLVAGVAMSVLPYFFLYRLLRPLLTGGSLTLEETLFNAGAMALCMVLYGLLYVEGLALSHRSAYHTLENLRLHLQSTLEKQPLGAIQEKGVGVWKKMFIDDIESMELLLAHALPEDLPEFFQRLLDWYRQPGRMGDGGAFALLDTLYDLPVDRCTDEEIEMLVEFAAFYFLRDALPLRISAARFFKVLTARLPHGHPSRRRIALLATAMPVENDVTTLFLQYRILSNLELDVTMHRRILYGTDVVSEIFLDNLKTGTPWIIKAVNIKLLADQVDQGRTDHILHIATHLCNLIKVSEQVVVRCDAGAALLRIVKLLTPDQRNEISVELVKGLEVGEYEFSKYIPQYLGEFALWLPPEQLDELIENLRASLSSANERIVCGALDTLAVILEYYGVYASQFAEPPEENRRRADRLLASDEVRKAYFGGL